MLNKPHLRPWQQQQLVVAKLCATKKHLICHYPLIGPQNGWTVTEGLYRCIIPQGHSALLCSDSLAIRQSTYKKDTSPNTGNLQDTRVSINLKFKIIFLYLACVVLILCSIGIFENFRISEGFGVFWSIFPLGPTCYQWWAGTNSLKYFMNKK